MKFLADMGISPGAVLFLRHLGYDAIHLHELGLDRLPDPQILLPDTSRHVKMDIENREVAETIQSTLALDDGHVVGRLAQDRGLV